jgi:hypothetical protein
LYFAKDCNTYQLILCFVLLTFFVDVSFYFYRPFNSYVGGDKGFVAMLVFAFLMLLIAFPITFARVAGLTLPKINSLEQSLRYEILLVTAGTVFYFLAVCVWGGTCFTKLRNEASVTGTGFGCIIFCFLALIIASALLFLQKINSEWRVGHESSGHSGTIGASEYDPHAYSYEDPYSENQEGSGYDHQQTKPLISRVK